MARAHMRSSSRPWLHRQGWLARCSLVKRHVGRLRRNHQKLFADYAERGKKDGERDGGQQGLALITPATPAPLWTSTGPEIVVRVSRA
jgi:hypothetical protein